MVRRGPRARYAIAVGLYLLGVVLAEPAVSAPAAQLVVLTQDRITLVDLASSRVAVSRATSPGEARKVTSAGSFVFLQRKQAVDVPTPYFVDEFRVHRGVLYGVSRVDDHLWLILRALGPETANTRRAP